MGTGDQHADALAFEVMESGVGNAQHDVADLVGAFIGDTLSCYRQVLDFIKVDYDGQTDFQPVEVSKFYRYRWLHLLLKRPPMRVVKYTLNIEQRARRKGKQKSRIKRMRKWLIRKNTVVRKRPPLDPAMRKQLRETFAGDIELLGRLLDRDLSHWQ
jgi:hypothetical protein